MYLILLIAGALLLLGILEKRNHLRRLEGIPVRIHVNGTRGKSLLTRLLAHGFHSGGRRTAAKVTGESPAVFHSSEGWSTWRRRGLPRIQEQVRFLREAEGRRAEVVIVENMAIAPEFLRVSEEEMMRSDVSIFTNFRVDHQEQGGASVGEVGAVLGNALPEYARVILPASESDDSFLERARARGNVAVRARPPRVPGDRLRTFDDLAGLVEAVGAMFDLPREPADGMPSADRGFPDEYRFLIPLSRGRERHLVDLFSCNDVESSRRIVGELEERGRIRPPYGVVLSCRIDRPLRSLRFLEWIAGSLGGSRLIVTGGCPLLPAKRILRRSEMPAEAVRFFYRVNPVRIREEVEAWDRDVLGLGNFVNTGERILSEWIGKDDGD